MNGRLEGSELAFAYRGVDGRRTTAVERVDLALEPGRVVALLGPNGSGKSTVVRLLAGLLPPDAGAVRVDGTRLDDLTDRERARRVAVVPQSLLRLPEVTVERFVTGGRYAHLNFWRQLGGTDRAAVASALERCSVASLRDRRLDELSGGQFQRALIARALAQEAEILLCDEPTSALDPDHQLEVLELLAALAEDGHAVLFVTHDLNLASQFADRAVVLDRGRIAADGSVQDVLRPDVLEPIYRARLHCTTLPPPSGRPLIVPVRQR